MDFLNSSELSDMNDVLTFSITDSMTNVFETDVFSTKPPSGNFDDDEEDGHEEMIAENDIDWEELIGALDPAEQAERDELTNRVLENLHGSIHGTYPPNNGSFKAEASSGELISGFGESSNTLEAPAETPRRRTKKRAAELQNIDDETKLMRTGSLGRIIVSSTAVSKPMRKTKKGSGVAPLKAAVAFSKIVDAFNACDLDSLSKIVRTQCIRDCELKSNALPKVIKGRNSVMMFWALQMETFPDGIWICTNSFVDDMTITRKYKFSGTRVFGRSTHALFDHVRHQAALVQTSDHSKSSYEIDVLCEILGSCWVSPDSPKSLTPRSASRAAAKSLGSASPKSGSPIPTEMVGAASTSFAVDTSTLPTSSTSASATAPLSMNTPTDLSLSLPLDGVAGKNGKDRSSSPTPKRSPRSMLPQSPFKVTNKSSPKREGSRSPLPARAVVPSMGSLPPSESAAGMKETEQGFLGTVASSFSTANVLALAIREHGNVVDSERTLTFTFNRNHEIVRIESFGDL